MHRDLRGQYEESKEAGWRAIKQGKFSEAHDHFEQGVTLARELADPALLDMALCNQAAISIEMGETAHAMPTLRRILMKNAQPEPSFRAAYSLARGYELMHDEDKALFYARIAHRHAASAKNNEQLAQSHNLLGNLLLARSEFSQAKSEFEQALSLTSGEPSIARGVILDNLGYCQVVLGAKKSGFRHLFASLRMLRKAAIQVYEASTLLSLSFAYLQIDRHREAIRHARRALEISEQGKDTLCLKYALFLLGEGEKKNGNPLAARYYFHRLQENYYPDSPEVPDLLLLLDVQQLINLKA